MTDAAAAATQPNPHCLPRSPPGPGPGETAAAFGRCLLQADAAGATSYFLSSAKLMTPDATEVKGRPAIHGVLSQLTTSEQELEIRQGRTIQLAEVALCAQYWRRGSKRSSPECFQMSSSAHLVLCRVGEGWKIAIADPWGRVEG